MQCNSIHLWRQRRCKYCYHTIAALDSLDQFNVKYYLPCPKSRILVGLYAIINNIRIFFYFGKSRKIIICKTTFECKLHVRVITSYRDWWSAFYIKKKIKQRLVYLPFAPGNEALEIIEVNTGRAAIANLSDIHRLKQATRRHTLMHYRHLDRNA